MRSKNKGNETIGRKNKEKEKKRTIQSWSRMKKEGWENEEGRKDERMKKEGWENEEGRMREKIKLRKDKKRIRKQ